MIPANRTAPWPYDFFALRDGAKLSVDGIDIVLSVIDCGELNLDGGQLIACDPFAGLLGAGRDAWIDVPPGRYPVQVTLADVSGRNDGSHLREAYASLLISDAPEVERKALCMLHPGASPTPVDDDDSWGFGVDSGTACFADRTSIDRDMPNPNHWHHGLFENADPGSWFHRMDDPKHLRDGLANIPLPQGDGSTNIILMHSGWGDGFFPVLGGFDPDGALVAVHIDFFVVGGPAGEGEDGA
jgi:hypothetical protein